MNNVDSVARLSRELEQYNAPSDGINLTPNWMDFAPDFPNAPTQMQLPAVQKDDNTLDRVMHWGNTAAKTAGTTRDNVIDVDTEGEDNPDYLPATAPVAVVENPLPTPPATPKDPKPCHLKERLRYLRIHIRFSENQYAFQLFKSFPSLTPNQQRKYCEMAWPSNDAAFQDVYEAAKLSPNFTDIYYHRLNGKAIEDMPQSSMTPEEATKKRKHHATFEEELKGSCFKKVKKLRNAEELAQLKNRIGNIRGKKKRAAKAEEIKIVDRIETEMRRHGDVELKRARKIVGKQKQKEEEEAERLFSLDDEEGEEQGEEGMRASSPPQEEVEEQSEMPARASSPPHKEVEESDSDSDSDSEDEDPEADFNFDIDIVNDQAGVDAYKTSVQWTHTPAKASSPIPEEDLMAAFMSFPDEDEQADTTAKAPSLPPEDASAEDMMAAWEDFDEQAGPTDTAANASSTRHEEVEEQSQEPAKTSSPPPEQAEEATEPMDPDGLDDLFEDVDEDDEEQDVEMIEVEDASEGEDDGFVYFLCNRK
jgi:hypothetical protein